MLIRDENEERIARVDHMIEDLQRARDAARRQIERAKQTITHSKSTIKRLDTTIKRLKRRRVSRKQKHR